MRLIDKKKKELKIKTFLYENCNNILLSLGLPCVVVHFFLTPFFPIVGIVALSLYGIIIGVGGFDILLNEDKRKYKLEALKRDVDILQGCNEQTVCELNKQIEETKELIEKPMEANQDKRLFRECIKRTRSILRELLNRKMLVEQAIEERKHTSSNEHVVVEDEYKYDI